MPATIRKPARRTTTPATIAATNARMLDDARVRRRPAYLAGSVTVECCTVGCPVIDPYTFASGAAWTC